MTYIHTISIAMSQEALSRIRELVWCDARLQVKQSYAYDSLYNMLTPVCVCVCGKALLAAIDKQQSLRTSKSEELEAKKNDERHAAAAMNRTTDEARPFDATIADTAVLSRQVKEMGAKVTAMNQSNDRYQSQLEGSRQEVGEWMEKYQVNYI
jgi:hypothetical protein